MKSLTKTTKIFLKICFIILVNQATAQQPSVPKAPPSSKVQKQIAKKKWKNERRIQHDAEQNIKEHDKRIQTKAVRKKMRKDKAKSKRINEHKREFFLKRWFKK